ncbi:GNAT family N-acetyltransferase [Geminocystis sp. GBBB08]|uniref:GNAT family N-acetyltransferase n=1 Tax=Geminocystis sp. GBBB08 TaxID=2604140 RepID=UPI0027E393C5|nr:GNAT family N-acetyltransferase [Geminocystis sp. GBBB08]
MTQENFLIRTIVNESEVNLMLSWAAFEGWNPGKYDSQTFYYTDPKGFFIGELNDQPIGCISAIAYDLTFGFLGFYIVQSEFRNQGFGIQLWQKAMEYLGNRNIGLDGVIAQQKNYEKSGFKIAYNHIRYQGIGGGKISDKLIDLNRISWEELITYDRQCFPTNRQGFLHNWIQQKETIALGFINNHKLQGYGVIRPAENGYRIGALFADNFEVADIIYQGLIADKKDLPVFIDIPSSNLLAQQLVKKYAMYPVFEAARMYNKNFPDIAINKIFGVTSLELG